MKILISAETFGYGPITTCLSVVKELKKHSDISVDFIGCGIALEQAKLSGYFDKYYECNVYDFESLNQFKEIFKSYKIFLSSENINGAIFALKYIKNTYYIDNLMWMWDKVPKELYEVKKFFISETFSSEENFKRIGKNIKNPVFIGPIRDMNYPKSKTVKNQLVINVGGASSFMFDQTIINKFYNKIINEVLSTPEIDRFNSIIICGGSLVIDSLKLNKKDKKIKIKTLDNKEYLKVMNESSHCIMSSGLGNFIETLNKDKNIMYLPAVNYSQLFQLQYYKKMKLGFKILNWDNFDFYKDIPLYLDEQTGVDLVVENVKKYNLQNYKEEINNFVKKYLEESQEKYFKKRNNNFESFDKNAALKIADIIYEDNK